MITIDQIRDVAFASNRNSVAISRDDFERIVTEMDARVDDRKGVFRIAFMTERGPVTILRDPDKTAGEISCPASSGVLPRIVLGPCYILRDDALPPHICLRISHNPHRGEYQTIEHWLYVHLVGATAGTGFTADDIIQPADRAAILATGEVWIISWCPSTPVGPCEVVAATLERALELASKVER